MAEDKIKNLLQDADRMAPRPAALSANLMTIIRHRAHRRRTINLTASIAAIVISLFALGTWGLTTKTSKIKQEQKKVASLEAHVQQLQARTDTVLKLIHEVLENERKQRLHDALQVQLVSIPDPLEEAQKQVDKTAFILVYQANRMYRELDQKDSAIQTYKRVIKLFPQTRWAETARQRLSEIENNNFNKPNSEGDLIWKPQKQSSSC